MNVRFRPEADIRWLRKTRREAGFFHYVLRLFVPEWQTGQSSAFAYIVLIMVVAITNIYVKYLNKVKER